MVEEVNDMSSGISFTQLMLNIICIFQLFNYQSCNYINLMCMAILLFFKRWAIYPENGRFVMSAYEWSERREGNTVNLLFSLIYAPRRHTTTAFTRCCFARTDSNTHYHRLRWSLFTVFFLLCSNLNL